MGNNNRDPDIPDLLLAWVKRLLMVVIAAFALLVVAYSLGYVGHQRLPPQAEKILMLVLVDAILMLLSLLFNQLVLFAASAVVLVLATFALFNLV